MLKEQWIQPELFLVPTPPKFCVDCNVFDRTIPPDNPDISDQDPKRRRLKGDGTGSIQLHYHKAKNGKSYEQYYYHYEIWENGVKHCKGSKYIPAKKLDLIRELDSEKKPVTLILKELGLVV